MKRRFLICLSVLIPLVFTVFLLSCEKNYITQVPEEHVPEYHMTFCYVTDGIHEPKYIITINTKTHQVIDSIELTATPYRDMAYIDGGNKAVITNYDHLYIEDALTHDTLAITDAIGIDIKISSDEHYIVSDESKYILSLPDFAIIDSTDTLRHIGIDGTNKILYAYSYPDSQIYSINFSATPYETTIVDATNMRGEPIKLHYYGYLSPDNETLLLSYICQGGYGLVEYDADSLYVRNEIECLGLKNAVWTSDGNICYGTNFDYNVVKYNIITKIYTIIIDQTDIYTGVYKVNVAEELYPIDIQITPDDKHLYVQIAGRTLFANGHTLVYDLEAKEFIYRYEYSKSLDAWNFMSLNPKDWSN